MKTSILAFASALFLSTAAMAAEVTLYQGTEAPGSYVSGSIGADLKSGKAYVTILFYKDGDFNNTSTAGGGLDDSSLMGEMYAKRVSAAGLELNAKGEITFGNKVCANVITKKFGPFKTHKVKPTGECKVVAVLTPVSRYATETVVKLQVNE